MKDKPGLPEELELLPPEGEDLKRPTIPKPKTRGETARDAGLSKPQRKLLVWLLQQEEAIKASGDKSKLKELNQKGIPWSAKRFYDDVYGKALSHNQRRSISRTLKGLEDSDKKGNPRRLVMRYDTTGGVGQKSRTSHVKLTPEGRHAAHFEREHGRTKRQIFEQEKDVHAYRCLFELRKSRREFQDAILQENLERGPVEVTHPFACEYQVWSNSKEFESLFYRLIREISKLAQSLDLPLTKVEAELLDDAVSREFADAPF